MDYSAKVLTIRSKTLSKTFSQSVYAKVLKNGFQLHSGNGDSLNVVSFENKTNSQRNMRRYSDVTGMFPWNPGLNPVKFAFLENSYIASTLPKDHRYIEDFQNNNQSVFDLPNVKTAHNNGKLGAINGWTGKAAEAENGLFEANECTLRRRNAKRMRRKTICGVPALRCVMVSQIASQCNDGEDEADREVQQILKQANIEQDKKVKIRVFCVVYLFFHFLHIDSFLIIFMYFVALLLTNTR